MKRSGLIAIAGQPNVGKSTLLNGLLEKKVAITSKRPETTRDNIRGILTLEDAQFVFSDTPGIHKPHDLLGKVMITRAQSSLMESDIILFLTEKRLALGGDDKNIVARLPKPDEGKTVILIINKVDRVKKKEMLLPIIEKAKDLYPFAEIVPMSALNQKHLDSLLKTIKKHLPKQPFLFPEEETTDKSDEFRISEIIREKILTGTYAEIPHSVAVLVDLMEEASSKGLFKIHATIFVEKNSQKSIIIGKGGSMLKQLGKAARLEIEKMLRGRVYLDLLVQVSSNWKKDPESLRKMGYAG